MWKERRGDIARGLLYMDVRYEGGSHPVTGTAEPDLILTNERSLIVTSGGSNAAVAYMGMLSVLIEWHELDPPDPRDQARNEGACAAQGNRNPFIDHPELVACVFEGSCMSAIFASGFE